MKSVNLISFFLFVIASLQIGFAQNSAELPASQSAPSILIVNPTPNISGVTTEKPGQITAQTIVAREIREQALIKLLEGQRYIWNLTHRSRSQATATSGIQLAKQALQKAIELDPSLAEGYTALAELISNTSPDDLEQAISLAEIAVKTDAQNFGGHRILARLYTIKSRLSNGILQPEYTRKAIAEWKEVARLDPRNAEAFAFLSEFYAETKKPTERIDALRKWLSAAAPLDSRFYRAVFGGRADLSPESATLKFGRALLETGESREAIEILSRAVTDNPENEEAIELLRQAVETADAASAAVAVQALQQAVFANPENTTLVEILARMQMRSGKINDAAKVLRDSSSKLIEKNKKSAAAALQFVLGDIYESANRFDESIAAYQAALSIREIGIEQSVGDDDRDFAIRVFGKMIDVYKKANRPNDAKILIDRARMVLGNADSFADKRLISFYLETGKKTEALQALRTLRLKTPADNELLKLEARILTESGKVDEAVALFKSASVRITGNGNSAEDISTGSVISPPVSKLLFISELYALAKRQKESVEAANQAFSIAKNQNEKEYVKLTLATLQQTNGDFNAAEFTLREMLKESPRNSIALNNLGYFLAERGEKLDEALKLVEQALVIDPDNPSYLDSLGWTYFKLGKLSEAEKSLQAAWRLDGTSSTIQEHLGDVYQKQGKIELAKSAWQKALSLTSETEEINRLNTKLKTR